MRLRKSFFHLPLLPSRSSTPATVPTTVAGTPPVAAPAGPSFGAPPPRSPRSPLLEGGVVPEQRPLAEIAQQFEGRVVLLVAKNAPFAPAAPNHFTPGHSRAARW